MSEYDFGYWYNYVATPQEKELANKIGEYEPLFEDMVFDSDEFEFCIPDEIKYFDITQVQFKIEQLSESCGYYNHKDKVLCISPEYANDTPTILHEMIHIYEEFISEYRYLHDVAFWNIYTALKEKIPQQIDDLITEQANTLYQIEYMNMGGTHDILFYLKSIDLDIKMSYPIGTIFNYYNLLQARETN